MSGRSDEGNVHARYPEENAPRLERAVAKPRSFTQLWFCVKGQLSFRREDAQDFVREGRKRRQAKHPSLSRQQAPTLAIFAPVADGGFAGIAAATPDYRYR